MDGLTLALALTLSENLDMKITLALTWNDLINLGILLPDFAQDLEKQAEKYKRADYKETNLKFARTIRKLNKQIAAQTPAFKPED